MSAVDDRVVLPLSQVRRAAALLCRRVCGAPRVRHLQPCLVPLLEQRDQLLTAASDPTAISGDCQDPIKHGACSGCACTCHHRRT